MISTIVSSYHILSDIMLDNFPLYSKEDSFRMLSENDSLFVLLAYMKYDSHLPHSIKNDDMNLLKLILKMLIEKD